MAGRSAEALGGAAAEIGYEISFNPYFYKTKALRPLEEIHSGLLAVEKETEGMLAEIMGGDA